MSAPTQQQISDALVTFVQTAAPNAKVWDRIRIATNDALYAPYYVQSDGVGNVWFIYPTLIRDEVTSFDDEISESRVYELVYARAIVDNDDSGLASFTLFKQQLEDVRVAFKADKYFGLANRGTTHSGLQVVQPISPNGTLGAYAFHVAICTLVITVAEC